MAMLAIGSISGFAGVMTELLLKNKSFGKEEETASLKPKLSIWDRNIQLAFWSIIFGAIAIMFDKFMINPEDAANSLFDGWSKITVLLVILWTMGGLLVALTIKYTNVIIKGFASAISLILICICGYLFLGDYLDVVFVIGATVTIIATFNYNDKEDSNVNKMVPIKK